MREEGEKKGKRDMTPVCVGTRIVNSQRPRDLLRFDAKQENNWKHLWIDRHVTGETIFRTNCLYFSLGQTVNFL